MGVEPKSHTGSKSGNSQRYCAFLRGVNVQGTRMKMSDVCSVFEDAGLREVSSVLASGNILFTAGPDADRLKTRLQTALSAHFGYEAFLFVVDETQIRAMAENNPFPAQPEVHVYVFVGSENVEEELMAVFEKGQKAPGEEAATAGGWFYWKVPKGSTLKSDFGGILGRKNLKDKFTSRNLNTLNKIRDKI